MNCERRGGRLEEGVAADTRYTPVINKNCSNSPKEVTESRSLSPRFGAPGSPEASEGRLSTSLTCALGDLALERLPQLVRSTVTLVPRVKL